MRYSISNAIPHNPKSENLPYETLANTGVPRFVLIITYGHSYAVAAIRAGDDIKTVQGNLGHATAAFTLDVYGHVTDQMK